jgi:archaeal flagellin FlaB
LNLIRKGHGHAHRGIIGVESAIVMIAFVIVAAALAFVVLNMGFSTTQKAKTTIISGLSSSSSALSVAGKVIGVACTTSGSGCGTTPYLNVTGIPIKISSGGDSVDLNPSNTQVKYLSNTIEYDNIYAGTLNTTTPQSLEAAWDDIAAGGYKSGWSNPVDESLNATMGIVYWSVSSGTQNSILDAGEHAVLTIGFSSENDADSNDERPTALDKIRVEIIVSNGAALTLERDIPTLTKKITDLG